MKWLTAILLILLLAGCGYRIHFFYIPDEAKKILERRPDPFDFESLFREFEEDRRRKRSP